MRLSDNNSDEILKMIKKRHNPPLKATHYHLYLIALIPVLLIKNNLTNIQQ